MHPFRLIQYIVVWFCICHLIIVILLKAVIFIWGWMRAAREEKAKAAHHFRKAAKFAKSNPGFDQESIDWYLSEARRIESEK